jgi:GTP-binding protein
MNIHNVQFLKSAVHLDQRPLPKMPEVAVVGRSNVGKSSLINALFNRRNLAKISSTPGKTRLINYFSVDDQLYFVDLPGYGFARLSEEEKNKWQKNIESYLKNNNFLKLVFLLIDPRHDLMKNDRIMIDWLNFYQIPFIFVLTKSDKISNNLFRSFNSKIRTEFPDQKFIRFSARKKTGRDEIIEILEDIVNSN